VATCNVSVEPLGTATYSALSYTWGMNATGDAEKTRAIILEDRRVLVTQNLLEGLQLYLYHINLAEQSAQVARMDKIYANASSVVVWLGEGQTESDDAAILRLFQRMQQHIVDTLLIICLLGQYCAAHGACYAAYPPKSHL
jgi:hypothetical protein